MTDQELFTKVATHLLTQNERSGWVGDCRYRWGALKCAAGCLIEDQYYRPQIEGFKATNCLVAQALKASGVAPEQLTLVHVLQRVHDERLVSAWREELQDLAARRGFEFPNL